MRKKLSDPSVENEEDKNANSNKVKLTDDEIFLDIENTLNKLSKKVEEKEKINADENLFCILGVQDFEIRHSNFLAWLFRTNKEFLFQFLIHEFALNIDSVEAKELSNDNYEVKREYNKDAFGRSIDIVIKFTDKKYAIIIENKLYSGEGDNQLSDYWTSIEKSEDFNNYKKAYVFLTLNGTKPVGEQDANHYISVSYSTILEILINLYGKSKVKSNKNLIINNYIEILKDKTVKVMDRVNKYYDMFKKYKDVMPEMKEYIPSIESRAQIERDIINNTCGIDLKSEKANSFVVFYNNEIQNICVSNNLPKDMFEFGVSNDPFWTMSFFFTIGKDKEKRYMNFCKEFREKFERKDRSKDANFVTLYTERFVVSNKTGGYLTETQFQEKIKEEFENLLNDKNSIYYQIVEFVKDYKF